MFESIRRWLERSRAAAEQVRPIRAPVCEPLERRLLMDAGLTGVEPLPAPETTAPAEVIVGANDDSPGPAPAATGTRNATELFATSPALFVENQGQWSDPSLRYVHDGTRVDVAATGSGMVFQVTRAREEGGQTTEDGGRNAAPPVDTEVLRFSASFVGARAVGPAGVGRAPSTFNYFVGAPGLWRQDVPAYERIVYEGLYEGIDLYVQGLGSHLKYEFHVAPGADWSPISIRYDGIGGLSLDAAGALVLDLGSGWGTLVDDRPILYQESDGQRSDVAGSFRMLDERTCAFDVTGSYDPTRVLVIDPNLVWSTYLGGSGTDGGYGVALDAAGNVYVAGRTESSNWTPGAPGTTFQGVSDAFVTKFSSTGACLWSTYLGGSASDWAHDVALDSGGNVYVTGTTEWPDSGGSDWTSNGFDTSHNGPTDAFVAKLSPAGSILWSTYVGGGDRDWGYGLAVDASDNVYVTGETWSPDNWTLGGYDMVFDGTSDAFVVKISPDGACLWSTYLGGGDRDRAYGAAVDPSGNVYVTGATLSSGWTAGGFDTEYGGGSDAFVVKLSPVGGAGGLLWSTYLGGAHDDYGQALAADGSGNVYVTGATLAADWTTQGFDATHNGVPDAFVAKLSSAGASLWSTALGGAAGDWGYGVAVDAAGSASVTGTTESPGWTSGGFDITYHGGASDAFVVKFGPEGAALWSSYLGGGSTDSGYGIAVDAAGYLYATGETRSAAWTVGGVDTSYHDDGSFGDAFLVKISFAALVPVYRFWNRVNNTHFYTMKESERQKLIDNYSDIYADEGPAFYAYGVDDHPLDTLPVYRFWKRSDNTHFFTMKESEKQKLIDNYLHIYADEGPAFYAYATAVDQHPLSTLPVYRFWKPWEQTHFFTISEREKDKLRQEIYWDTFTFEYAVWYAFLVPPGEEG